MTSPRASQLRDARSTGALGSTERALARGFFALAGLTYVLIVLGALVRAHGAGLSCPDWPLCFGEVIPTLDFKVAFEFGHRVLAGSVALLFTGLAIATARQPVVGRALRPWLVAGAVLLALQIVLGGLTVLELLARWTVTSHLVTGNAFALTLVLTGRRFAPLRSEPATADGSLEASASVRGATSVVAALLVVQIALGGLVSSSYAGLACPDWPACMNEAFLPTLRGVQGLHVLHRSAAYTLVVALPVCAWLARATRPLARFLALASALVVCQAAVGVANVLLRLPVEITALHSALAAALVCTLGLAVDVAWRKHRA